MSGRERFKRLSFLLVLLIGILLLHCSKSPTGNKKDAPEEPIPDLSSVEKRLIESDNKFGLKLFKEIVKEGSSDSNVFISPLSVAMALGMTYNGAAGETQKAMQEALELEGFTLEEVNQCYQHLLESLAQLDPKVEFGVANSIWYRESEYGPAPREEFLNLCDEYYSALVRGLDFNDPSSVDTINMWVDEKTNGRIQEIVDKPIDRLAMMFLINAIYFKGTWTYEFDENETKDDWFFLPGDSTRKPCRMMEQKALFGYFENHAFRAVDLPYGDEDFRMTVFVPPYGADLNSLIREFDQEKLNYWLSCFENDSVSVYLPRLKLEYDVKLNDVLTALGMGIAFNPQFADFSKMYEHFQVYIHEVKHKTFVEVNEEGTEAAAVTSVGIRAESRGDPPFTLRAERPFVFMIRENVSGTILFIGKIVDPGYEESLE